MNKIVYILRKMCLLNVKKSVHSTYTILKNEHSSVYSLKNVYVVCIEL